MGRSTLAKSKKTINNHIVKRGGHSEPFDERKVYASVFASCQAVRVTQQVAEMIAESVGKDMALWLTDKHEVTSHDIRLQAAKALRNYNSDAGWILINHRNIN